MRLTHYAPEPVTARAYVVSGGGPGQVMPRIRGANAKFTAGLETAQRDAEAARLRTRAMSYREIAETLGYADESHAYQGVQRCLRATISEPSEEVRRLEVQRLDRLYEAALKVLERMHVTVSNGRVVSMPVEGTGVRDPETGNILGADWAPVLDDAPVLQAIDRLLKIQDRRARYLGLDAPTRMQVVTVDAVDAEIARLTAELAQSEPRPAGQAAAPA